MNDNEDREMFTESMKIRDAKTASRVIINRIQKNHDERHGNYLIFQALYELEVRLDMEAL